MIEPRRQGIERRIFSDPETGREVWRLTHSDTMADRHTYYDINPWSPDGTQIVFSTAPIASIGTPVRDLLSSDQGEIYLMDAETFELSWLAGDGAYQTHNGAHPAWHPDGTRIFYNHNSGQMVSVAVASGEIAPLPGRLRQISPDGRTIVWTVNHDAALAERGVYTMRADGSDRRLVIPSETVYGVTPNRDLFTPERITVGNTKWSPDGRQLLLTIWIDLFKTPDQFDSPGIRRSLYIANPDGSDLRWLTHFGHHHSWTPDGRSVLYCDWNDPETRKEPRLFLIDADGTDRRVAIDAPLGGHPIMDPGGTRIATWDDRGVIIVNVPEQRWEYAATFGEGFDMSHRGTHPHPVWKADGTQLLYNSAQFGHSQLCLLPMGTR